MKSESFQVSSDSVVGMSIVPMKVNVKGQDKKALIYALLDSGSNTSFCTEDLLNQLNTKGERATLSLTTMRKSNKTTKKKKALRFKRGQRKCASIRANPADQKTITTVNRYECHDLSV